MKRPSAFRIAAVAGSFALGAYCAGRYRRELRARRQNRKSEKHDVATWEGEGGNVPSVPTPMPSPPPL